ncbi:hypothetical protein TSAR_013051 [Trichomalopsis sarcophagae]|uniref:VM domain-containing protein n=1 Tax=Trichomalopsis sarcophagae TaxID=543379 RepID=A0A232FLT9_9HYME|nr:hypothetical protein TSAR_013051 [Trichomalopsis sarcophagae]
MSLINVRVLLVIAGLVSGGLAQFYSSRAPPCQQPYLPPFASGRNENGNGIENTNVNSNTNANQALRYSTGSGMLPQSMSIPRSPFQPLLPISSTFYSSQPRPLSPISRYNTNPTINVLPSKNIDDNVNANFNINSNQNYNENANANRYVPPVMPTPAFIPPRPLQPLAAPTNTRSVWTRPSVSFGSYPVGNLNANANENTNVNINDNGNINANAFRRNMHGSTFDEQRIITESLFMSTVIPATETQMRIPTQMLTPKLTAARYPFEASMRPMGCHAGRLRGVADLFSKLMTGSSIMQLGLLLMPPVELNDNACPYSDYYPQLY